MVGLGWDDYSGGSDDVMTVENKKPDSDESGLAVVMSGFFLAAARNFSA
jgi:hypothetical protein